MPSSPLRKAASPVTVERRGRVALVRFDRGDGRNALSVALIEALTETARTLAADHRLGAVILTGAPQAFSVGMDLKDPRLARLLRAGIGERRHAVQAGRRLCAAWAALEPLTICAVEGYCIGGGVALALACDLIVCGASARFSVPEIDRGMNLSWGAVPRLVDRVGAAQAKRIAMLGEMHNAAVASALGLVEAVVASGEALAEARRLARLAAAKPPVALRMIKQGVDAYAAALADTASRMDADQFTLATLAADFAEAMASFRARRKPRFSGR
jgi:enoyl-CoA hydratase/carnithine racemase